MIIMTKVNIMNNLYNNELIKLIKDYCESKIDPNTKYLDDYELGFVKGEEYVAEEILWIIEQFEKENN